MTRDEAIIWLNQIKRRYIFGGDEGFDASRKEALDMAIEALSEETPTINEKHQLSEETPTNAPTNSPTDLISRADAMGAVQDHFNADGFKGYDDGQKMMDRINALPSAEAVEVVRCRDCKWYGHIGCAIEIKDDSDRPKPDDFCSFGERRTK